MKQLLVDQIGVLGSGETVYDRFDNYLSQTAEPQLKKFLPLALQRIQSKNKVEVTGIVDFGVVVNEVYGKQTSKVSFSLKKIREGYQLVSANFGDQEN